MNPRWLALGLLVALLATQSGVSAPPAPPQARAITLEATAVPCPAGRDAFGDGICLAYNGRIPGPTIDVNLLDRVTVTLVNHIGQTIWTIPGPQAVKARLANASVSFHVHGTALPITDDGISGSMSPAFPDSFAEPGQSRSYHLHAVYNGTWQYHDHVLGMDGVEGDARGLVGTLAVRAGGDVRPDAILDVHAMDIGPFALQNGTVAAGGSFELVGATLGDWTWTYELDDPAGHVVRTMDLGPGMAEHIVVEHAQAGSYRWSVTNDLTTESFPGTVVVG